MTFDRQFLDMMPQTVTVTAFSALSSDGLGAQSYSSGRSVRARIEQKRKLVRDAGGREVTSETTVYTPPYDTASTAALVINPMDQLTLPSGFLVAGSSAPPIINVERGQDENAEYGFAVYL